MKTLVTGGAGFIGSQLGIALHRDGHDVVLLDDMSFGHLDNLLLDGAPFGRFVCQDICDAIINTFKNLEAVFPWRELHPYLCVRMIRDAPIASTLRASETSWSVLGAPVFRVIFSSTSAVYEKSKSALFSEAEPIAPDLVYASGKAAAEQLCETFATNYGMDICIARFFNVYGPHQNVARTSPPFTSYVARELVKNRSPNLFNKTEAKRDYAHSDDDIRLLQSCCSTRVHFAPTVQRVLGQRV